MTDLVLTKAKFSANNGAELENIFNLIRDLVKKGIDWEDDAIQITVRRV